MRNAVLFNISLSECVLTFLQIRLGFTNKLFNLCRFSHQDCKNDKKAEKGPVYNIFKTNKIKQSLKNKLQYVKLSKDAIIDTDDFMKKFPQLPVCTRDR